MGQAKRRGNREERIAQSIERKAQEEAERQRRHQEWWDSLTPEQQEAWLKNRERGRRAMRLFGAMSLLGDYTYRR